MCEHSQSDLPCTVPNRRLSLKHMSHLAPGTAQVNVMLQPAGMDPTGMDPTGMDPTGMDPTDMDPITLPAHHSCDGLGLFSQPPDLPTLPSSAPSHVSSAGESASTQPHPALPAPHLSDLAATLPLTFPASSNLAAALPPNLPDPPPGDLEAVRLLTPYRLEEGGSYERLTIDSQRASTWCARDGMQGGMLGINGLAGAEEQRILGGDRELGREGSLGGEEGLGGKRAFRGEGSSGGERSSQWELATAGTACPTLPLAEGLWGAEGTACFARGGGGMQGACLGLEREREKESERDLFASGSPACPGSGRERAQGLDRLATGSEDLGRTLDAEPPSLPFSWQKQLQRDVKPWLLKDFKVGVFKWLAGGRHAHNF